MKKLFWLTLTLIIINPQDCREALAYDNISNSPIIQIAIDTPNNSTLDRGAKLERQAQKLYESGKTSKAIPLLEEAISLYRTKENITGEAIAKINLALIYQQLGQWERAEVTINNIIALLPQITAVEERIRLFAQTLDVRGQLELSLGKGEIALATWKQAAVTYRKIGDLNRFTRSKIYQAQALQTQGMYARAIDTLTQIRDDLKTEPNNALKVKALQSIGDVLRRVGSYEESVSALQESLAIAELLESPSTLANIYLNLGNTLRLQEEEETALEYYNKAIAISPLPEQQTLGKLNQLSILIGRSDTASAITLVTEIKNLFSELSPSPTSIDARISLVRNLSELKQNFPNVLNLAATNSDSIGYLTTAIAEARQIGNRRRESSAIGNLGTLYEREGQLAEAQELSKKALLIAQTINASDLSYQWQWQLGIIYRDLGEREKAIAAYTKSVADLTALRSDLVAVSSTVRFSFRDDIEPVYRQLVDLLLQPSAEAVSQTALQQARKVIESLQLAELDNFFRDSCLNVEEVEIDRLDPSAATIYTILLKDRLEVIVAIPGQPLKNYKTAISQEDLEIEITSLLSTLKLPQRQLELALLQQLYQWTIAPIEADLAANQINTIVFVSDGILRNVPPGVLHDGDRYLIEKYRVAIVPGLQLVAPRPQAIAEPELLLAGVTKAIQDFPSLPGVKKEINAIDALYQAEVLLDNSFTEENFNQTVEKSDYKIVHLATHGKFSSNLEDTFILTWDERINIDELNTLIRADPKQLEPLELLVLSACETATGDKQATLGLAGIAVRAGARSTLASLWAVSDEATVMLMSNFYRELKNSNITKAEAIKRAQEKVLQNETFSHPYYWSAFILVGNWL